MVCTSDRQLEKKVHEGQFDKFCFEQAPFSVFRHREDGRLLDVNLKASETLGYSREELCNMSIYDIDPLVTPQQLQSIWQAVCEAGTTTFESVHRRKDGTTFPVEITTRLLEIGGDRFAVSFVKDIGKRKKIEDELQIAKFYFEKASFPIFRIGMNGIILNVNEHARKLLGYTHEELCNMTLLELDPAVDAEKLDGLWQRTLKEGALRFETLHRKKDGTTVPVEVMANLFECNGEFYSVCFVHDISERKKSEIENEKIKTLLLQRQKMEALGTLAGGIAHDFNNILGAISGYTELARIVSEPGSKSQKYLDQIVIAGERAKDLVNQILLFSRQTKAESKPLDLSCEINQVLKLTKVSMPKKIEIRQDVPSDFGAVVANKTQINQIIMNLCTNAQYAMKDKGGVLDISLSPFTLNDDNNELFDPKMRPGEYLKLCVKDTGHGIDQETLSRIFEPYFTTKPTGEGTGMGLATVHGIVKEHGGDIRVESEIGSGTKFEIILPVVDEVTGNHAETAAVLPEGNELILLIDDEISLVETGKDFLQSLGYTVETRMNPYDAIEAFRARSEQYDLVITDMNLPQMSGDLLAEEINKIRPDVPIIVASGFSHAMEMSDLRKKGISNLLRKPVNFHDLANTVRNALDERKKAAVSPGKEGR